MVNIMETLRDKINNTQEHMRNIRIKIETLRKSQRIC